MGIYTKTPWKYETSEETSYSGFVFSGGEGKLYLKHQHSGKDKKLNYAFGGIGVSKGAIINFAQSLTSDDSGGVSHVYVRNGLDLETNVFPCQGYIISFGGTAGIFQPSFLSHSGVSTALMVFGFVPMGYVWVWGRFNSILPSVGPSVLGCTYRP